MQGEKFIAGREIFRAKQGYCALALFPHHAAILRREAQNGGDRVDSHHQDCRRAWRRQSVGYASMLVGDHPVMLPAGLCSGLCYNMPAL